MITSALILVFSAFLTNYLLRPTNGYKLIAWSNFLLLAIFSIGFSQFTASAISGVDALKYFRLGVQKDLSGVDRLAQADLMYWISGSLQRSLPVDYMAFNLIGAMLFTHIALLLVMRLSNDPPVRLKFIWWLVTLSPGFHFWNSSFGKDSLQLLLIASIFYFQNLIIKGGGLLVLLLLRPHIAVVLGISIGIAEFLRKGITFRKLLIISACILVLFAAIEYLVQRLGGGGISLTNILLLFSEYGQDWKEGSLRNSDISSPFALIEFLWRPYPWEVNSVFTLFAFFDTVLVASIVCCVVFIFSKRAKFNERWIFMVLVTILLAFTNPNVGTAMRKKQMLPFLALAVAAIPAVVKRRRTQFAKVN